MSRGPHKSAPKKLDTVSEEFHELSFTEGHHNYFAWAEGIAFAAWYLRQNRYIPAAEAYSMYLKAHRP